MRNMFVFDRIFMQNVTFWGKNDTFCQNYLPVSIICITFALRFKTGRSLSCVLVSHMV